MLVKTLFEFMYFEHVIKDGFIPFHTQRNTRYLFIVPMCIENKLYDQGTNRAIARQSGSQFD